MINKEKVHKHLKKKVLLMSSTVIFRAISTPQIIFKSPKKHMVTSNPGKQLPSESELKLIIIFWKQKQNKTYISRLISIGPQSIMTVYTPDPKLPRFNYTRSLYIGVSRTCFLSNFNLVLSSLSNCKWNIIWNIWFQIQSLIEFKSYPRVCRCSGKVYWL